MGERNGKEEDVPGDRVGKSYRANLGKIAYLAQHTNTQRDSVQKHPPSWGGRENSHKRAFAGQDCEQGQGDVLLPLHLEELPFSHLPPSPPLGFLRVVVQVG